MHKEYYVYIVRCSDGSYYTGMTSDLSTRITAHQCGYYKNCYTYSRRPVELVYQGYFTDVWDAIAWEREIKRWTRKKKEAVIEGRFLDLPGLAQNNHHRSISLIQKSTHKRVMVRTVEP